RAEAEHTRLSMEVKNGQRRGVATKSDAKRNILTAEEKQVFGVGIAQLHGELAVTGHVDVIENTDKHIIIGILHNCVWIDGLTIALILAKSAIAEHPGGERPTGDVDRISP